jgi:surfactin synthase thioesterase subunit
MKVKSSVLVCIPPAGSGASFFRSWRSSLPVVSLRLPGRESRFADPSPTRLPWLADDLLPQLDEATAGYHDVVLFGHSFGAMVAFELSHMLSRTGRNALLVASGAAVPGALMHQPVSQLADTELAARVAELTGYSHPAMEDPDLLELIAPALRGDLRLHEEYVPVSGRLPGVPVLGVRGSEDRLIPPAAVRAWEGITSGPFRYAEVPGGHMYLAEDPTELIRLTERFASDVSPLVATSLRSDL